MENSYVSQWLPSAICLPTFFKISSFVLNKRKKHIQFWNDMGMSKSWHNFYIWGNFPFKCDEKHSRESLLSLCTHKYLFSLLILSASSVLCTFKIWNILHSAHSIWLSTLLFQKGTFLIFNKQACQRNVKTLCMTNVPISVWQSRKHKLNKIIKLLFENNTLIMKL